MALSGTNKWRNNPQWREDEAPSNSLETNWVQKVFRGSDQLSAYSGLKLLQKIRDGRVLVCKDSEDKEVVIKQYFLNGMSRSRLFEVRREMDILGDARLSHPNIVRSGIAGFEEAGSMYLVMEYAPNGDLYSIAGRFPKRQLSEKLVSRKVLLPICQAVAFLHSHGFIHRDIKPENIVVCAGGVPKLCDFGLAIDTASEAPVSAVGTLEYMAPELLKLSPMNPWQREHLRRFNGARYCAKVDVWALGCLAFELLLGRSPFVTYRDADEAEVRAAIIAGVPQLANLPAPIADSNARRIDAIRFMHAALCRDPARRPSAEGLLRLPWLAAAAPAEGAAAAGAARPQVSGGELGRGCSHTQSMPQVSSQRAAPREALGGSGRSVERKTAGAQAPAPVDGIGGASREDGDGGSRRPRSAPLPEEHNLRLLRASRFPRPFRMTMPSSSLER